MLKLVAAAAGPEGRDVLMGPAGQLEDVGQYPASVQLSPT